MFHKEDYQRSLVDLHNIRTMSLDQTEINFLTTPIPMSTISRRRSHSFNQNFQQKNCKLQLYNTNVENMLEPSESQNSKYDYDERMCRKYYRLPR